MNCFCLDNLESFEPELVETMLEATAPVPLEAGRRARLRERILARPKSKQDSVILPEADGVWLDFLPGVKLRPLRIDRRERTQTSLWRMTPGSIVPSHPHTGDEECLVLDGTLFYDGGTYRRGDFLLAKPGMYHTPFTTDDGGNLLLIRSELSMPLEALFTRAGF
jgi:anti-sigma factor ChrR (cupin superfamily)